MKDTGWLEREDGLVKRAITFGTGRSFVLSADTSGNWSVLVIVAAGVEESLEASRTAAESEMELELTAFEEGQWRPKPNGGGGLVREAGGGGTKAKKPAQETPKPQASQQSATPPGLPFGLRRQKRKSKEETR